MLLEAKIERRQQLGNRIGHQRLDFWKSHLKRVERRERMAKERNSAVFRSSQQVLRHLSDGQRGDSHAALSLAEKKKEFMVSVETMYSRWQEDIEACAAESLIAMEKEARAIEQRRELAAQVFAKEMEMREAIAEKKKKLLLAVEKEKLEAMEREMLRNSLDRRLEEQLVQIGESSNVAEKKIVARLGQQEVQDHRQSLLSARNSPGVPAPQPQPLQQPPPVIMHHASPAGSGGARSGGSSTSSTPSSRHSASRPKSSRGRSPNPAGQTGMESWAQPTDVHSALQHQTFMHPADDSLQVSKIPHATDFGAASSTEASEDEGPGDDAQHTTLIDDQTRATTRRLHSNSSRTDSSYPSLGEGLDASAQGSRREGEAEGLLWPTDPMEVGLDSHDVALKAFTILSSHIERALEEDDDREEEVFVVRHLPPHEIRQNICALAISGLSLQAYSVSVCSLACLDIMHSYPIEIFSPDLIDAYVTDNEKPIQLEHLAQWVSPPIGVKFYEAVISLAMKVIDLGAVTLSDMTTLCVTALLPTDLDSSDTAFALSKMSNLFQYHLMATKEAAKLRQRNQQNEDEKHRLDDVRDQSERLTVQTTEQPRPKAISVLDDSDEDSPIRPQILVTSKGRGGTQPQNFAQRAVGGASNMRLERQDSTRSMAAAILGGGNLDDILGSDSDFQSTESSPTAATGHSQARNNEDEFDFN